MATRLWNLVLGLATRLGFSREWWLLVVAAGVGLIMGVAGYLFIKPIQWLEHLAEEFGTESPSTLLWLLPIIPVIGAVLTGVLRWRRPAPSAARPGGCRRARGMLPAGGPHG